MSVVEAMREPLLIIDGDSFAHRAYHALPKSIRRRGDRGGGAIVGFANFLLRFYETEKPRAVLVDGIRSTNRPTGTRPYLNISPAESSMRSLLSSSTCCPSL
jgi:5'-3' exonuclease